MVVIGLIDERIPVHKGVKGFADFLHVIECKDLETVLVPGDFSFRLLCLFRSGVFFLVYQISPD